MTAILFSIFISSARLRAVSGLTKNGFCVGGTITTLRSLKVFPTNLNSLELLGTGKVTMGFQSTFSNQKKLKIHFGALVSRNSGEPHQTPNTSYIYVMNLIAGGVISG